MNRWAPASPLVFQRQDRLGNVKMEVAAGLPARLHIAAILANTIAPPPMSGVFERDAKTWAHRLLDMADALCSANREDAENEEAKQRILKAVEPAGPS